LLIGVLVQPWTLLIAGDLAVLDADLHHVAAVFAIGLFCIIGSAVMIGLQVVAVAAPERADDRLGALRTWLETHQSMIVTVLAIIIGVLLAIKGGSELL
jgi:hypothetical protein